MTWTKSNIYFKIKLRLGPKSKKTGPFCTVLKWFNHLNTRHSKVQYSDEFGIWMVTAVETMIIFFQAGSSNLRRRSSRIASIHDLKKPEFKNPFQATSHWKVENQVYILIQSGFVDSGQHNKSLVGIRNLTFQNPDGSLTGGGTI